MTRRDSGSAYDRFKSTCDWGVLDATSLVAGYKRYPVLNESDAAWVANIAASFRRAGGSGDVVSLPDAAIAASLRQAGLSDTRAALTFDSPTAYGFPPTTGFTNDPINTASGNFVEREDDLVFGGLLERLPARADVQQPLAARRRVRAAGGRRGRMLG